METIAVPAKPRLKRFIREPHKLPTDYIRNLTDKSFYILTAILQYRFLPSSFIVALTGDERNTHRHLQHLYHAGYVNRFAFPLRTSHFVYYIDSQDTIDLLADRGVNFSEEEREEYKATIRNNRENEYHLIHRASDPDRKRNRHRHASNFINHELKISRFHVALELACRQMAGKVELALWVQGAPLFNRVEVPKAVKDPHDYNVYMQSRTETIKLPHRPDVLFQLRFPKDPPERQLSSFTYEADRKTESTSDYRLKLRAHYYFSANIENRPKPMAQIYGAKYGIQHLRAVLTETEDQAWSDRLREFAKHPIVSAKPSSLFWFMPSTILTAPMLNNKSKTIPAFLANPKILFQRLWKNPADDRILSLLD